MKLKLTKKEKREIALWIVFVIVFEVIRYLLPEAYRGLYNVIYISMGLGAFTRAMYLSYTKKHFLGNTCVQNVKMQKHNMKE